MVERGAEVQLAEYAKEFWEGRLEEQPVFATAIGIRKYDDRLADITPEARERSQAWREGLLGLLAGVREQDLEPSDRITLSALRAELETDLDYQLCAIEEWSVDLLQGPQVGLMNIESIQPIRTPFEGRAMVKRWRGMAGYLDDHVANLRRGLAAGRVAVGAGVEKVIEELEDLKAKPDAEWALLRPQSVPHEDWSNDHRDEFRELLRASVRDYVRPAFLRYLDFLKSEVLPRTRPQERAGLMHLAGGIEDYGRLIHSYTALNLSPEEIHETGLREVARISAEMSDLGEKVFGTPDRTQILARLRTDASLYFSNRDEVATKAEQALARAKAAIPRFFGRLPKADCVVTRMGDHEEKHSTIAYYRQPAPDGSRPGQYYINTSAPETRPRYEAEALAYHEAIPGHHLQLAISQELESLPEFRKHGGVTAFIEGWGLYSERLANDMGLYSSDLDRIGMLSYDAWRACRLVVDTGMHARGWSRQQAIDYMVENTALAQNNIVNEVDRYITWPGQALAYKTGQMEIFALRREAQKRLGSKFELAKFHDAVLENGAIPLQTLRDSVERYVARAN